MPLTQQPRGPRGVFRRRVLSAQGNPLVEVVDSQNRRIFEREVFPTDDREVVEDWLWRLLDQRDPLPLQMASAG